MSNNENLLLPDLHASVDDYSWVFFDARLEREWTRSVENELQALFCKLMRKAHGDDFTETLPWGPLGDDKCDGFLTKDRTLFAVYGPRDFEKSLADGLDKVTSDHDGAIVKWRASMDRWTLVHNLHRDRLPAKMLQLLIAFNTGHPGLIHSHWGLENSRVMVRSWSRSNLSDVFGAVPDRRDFGHLKQEDLLKLIIELGPAIDSVPSPPSDDVRPVPAHKADFNRLSETVRALLGTGARYTHLVQRVFDRHPDPRLGERTVALFGNKYQELRGRDSTDIFNDLYDSMTSMIDPSMSRSRVAVCSLTLLAYLFEACHIFERPPAIES